MEENQITQLSAFPGWIVGVTHIQGLGYRCWVITPEQVVLNDGEVYDSSAIAMEAGRVLVHHSLELGVEEGKRWL